MLKRPAEPIKEVPAGPSNLFIVRIVADDSCERFGKAKPRFSRLVRLVFVVVFIGLRTSLSLSALGNCVAAPASVVLTPKKEFSFK
jgi:hypothetical protein